MLYWIGRFMFTLIFMSCFRWQFHGYENIPGKGPLIICSNHISWFDPPLVGCLVRKRKVFFMAKEELFKFFLFRWILKGIGTFPVKRDIADRWAIRRALNLLGGGQIVGMFPEGTRSKTGDIQSPFNGAALIAIKSKSPVLPIAIVGPYRIFHPIKVFIGSPITFKESTTKNKKRVALEKISLQIMNEIKKLKGKENKCLE